MAESRDTVDYVKYLLEGSGAESSVDYGQLRREFESMSTPKVGDVEFIHPHQILAVLSP